MGAVLIGIDVGSSSCKVTALDRDGRVLASAEKDYVTRYPRRGWAEVNPEDWYFSACEATHACVARGNLDPGDVEAIAVAGPAHNVALLDGADKVLHPTLHWSDVRSFKEAQELEDRNGSLIRTQTLQQPHPSWTLAQLMWVRRHEPEAASRLRRFCVTKDYVRYRLTGVYSTDLYDAIGTQLFDVGQERWSEELLSIVGLTPDAAPRVEPPTSLNGSLTARGARDLGLKEGTPVAVGSGDSAVEAAAAGAVTAGDVVVKLGTSANINAVSESPIAEIGAMNYPHVTGEGWLAISATNAGTATMKWFRDTFCQYEQSEAVRRSVDVFELIHQLSAKAPGGSDGLLFHPYLNGERSPYWDPNIRGQFSGIGMQHGRHHFARSILEGVAYSLRDCMDAVSARASLNRFWLLGGGARSALWRRIVVDVLGVSCVLPRIEGASAGSALLAGIAAGVFPDWRTASDALNRGASREDPDPAASVLYDRYFAAYKTAVPSVKYVNDALNRVVDIEESKHENTNA